jgi:hypothetical protein
MKTKNQTWLQVLFFLATLAFLIIVGGAFYALIQHWDLIISRITIAGTEKESKRDAVAAATQAVSAVFQGTLGVAASLVGSMATIFLGYASLKTSKAALTVSAQAERRESQIYATESLTQAFTPFFALPGKLTGFNEDLTSKMHLIWDTAKVAAAECVVDSCGVTAGERERRVLRILAHPEVMFPLDVVEQIRKQPREIDGKLYATCVEAWLATSEIAKTCSAICKSLNESIIDGLEHASRTPYSLWLERISDESREPVSIGNTLNDLRSAQIGTSLQALAVDFVARSVREASFYCLSTKEKAQGIAPLIVAMKEAGDMVDRIDCAMLGMLGNGYIVRYLLEQRDDAAGFEKLVRLLPDEEGIKKYMLELVDPSPVIERTSTSFYHLFAKRFDDSFWNAFMAYNRHPETRIPVEEIKEREAQRCAAFLLYQTPDTKDCVEELLRLTGEP